MSKKGMKRPQRTHNKPRNKQLAVPEIKNTEKPISNVYREVDNDLARDNLENDIPEADLQDL